MHVPPELAPELFRDPRERALQFAAVPAFLCDFRQSQCRLRRRLPRRACAGQCTLLVADGPAFVFACPLGLRLCIAGVQGGLALACNQAERESRCGEQKYGRQSCGDPVPPDQKQELPKKPGMLGFRGEPGQIRVQICQKPGDIRVAVVGMERCRFGDNRPQPWRDSCRSKAWIFVQHIAAPHLPEDLLEGRAGHGKLTAEEGVQCGSQCVNV